MCVCQIKWPKWTEFQWHWAMTEQLIKDEKWPIESFRWRQKNEASAEWKCRWWQQQQGECASVTPFRAGGVMSFKQTWELFPSLPQMQRDNWQRSSTSMLDAACQRPSSQASADSSQSTPTDCWTTINAGLLDLHTGASHRQPWCPRFSPRARPFCGPVRFVHVQGVRDKTQVCFCRSWLLVSMVCYQTENTLIDLLPD